VSALGENQPPCPSGRYWRVEAGDTFYLIALRTGTTVEELFRLNPGVDPDNLQIGQLVCLPEQVCPSGVFWVVAAGDTLYSIARAAGTTVEELLALNPGVDPQNLQIGQVICLP
jgi:LysM repeat protein